MALGLACLAAASAQYHGGYGGHGGYAGLGGYSGGHGGYSGGHGGYDDHSHVDYYVSEIHLQQGVRLYFASEDERAIQVEFTWGSRPKKRVKKY